MITHNKDERIMTKVELQETIATISKHIQMHITTHHKEKNMRTDRGGKHHESDKPHEAISMRLHQKYTRAIKRNER